MEISNITMKEHNVDYRNMYSELMGKIFPLDEHPLYGSVEQFNDMLYLDPKILADFTHENEFEGDVTNLEICPTCFFQTSGTTSRSKRIPYSDNDLERQREHEAIAFSKLGMTSKDVVMTLGSPLPSISGWATINGSEALGASVVNTSQIDYDVVFQRNQQHKVTFMFATPIVAREIGLHIEEEYGLLKDVFPNLKTAVIFGDVLPKAMRDEIKDIWGLDNLYSLYGTVEADVVATECSKKQGHQHLMVERLLFEIIPEEELIKERTISNYEPKSISALDVKDKMIGEIIISDLSREILPLIRYRIGDVVEVSTAECGCGETAPTVSVLGRSKNTVYIGDTPLYEMQINAALEKALGTHLIDWRLVKNSKSVHPFTLYVQADDLDEVNKEAMDKFRFALIEIRYELARENLEQAIEVKGIDSIEQAPVKGDAKARRIVL